MSLDSAVAGVKAIQLAFTTIAILQFTTYMWPKQACVKDKATFDYIVVGAGSAGCVVAGRLAEDKENNVLLIEAGDDPPLEVMVPSTYFYLARSRLDWNYTSQDQCSAGCHDNGTINLIRGKVVGGSASVNGMLYVRGAPHDFDTWAEIVQDDTWSWNGVLPTFMKSERLEDTQVLQSSIGKYHGTDGPVGVTRQPHDEEVKFYTDAVKELGHKILLDINAGETIGFYQSMYTVAEGVRQSTAYAYISPKKDYPNLHLLKRTLVTKIIFDEYKNAVAVEVLTENNDKIIINAKKEIIISAGAFNSPQLLMLSGIGPRTHLESLNIEVVSDLPVGKNLHYHIGNPIVFQMDKSDAPPPPPRKPSEFPGFPLIGNIALNKSQLYPDYQPISFVQPDSEGTMVFCSFFYGLKDDVCQQLYNAGLGKNTYISVIFFLNPKSRGQVSLRSTDPLEYPLIDLNIFSVDEDLDKAVSFIEDFIQICNTTQFKSVNAEVAFITLPSCPDAEFGTTEYWRCYARCMVLESKNYVGTCAMGSVLDSKLRVLGVSRLRVADASSMPYITSGNTNAPTIMIGEKAAEFIKQDCM